MTDDSLIADEAQVSPEDLNEESSGADPLTRGQDAG